MFTLIYFFCYFLSSLIHYEELVYLNKYSQGRTHKSLPYKMMNHNLFFIFVLTVVIIYPVKVFSDSGKYDTPCGGTPPYHLLIYSDNEHYYLEVKITNTFPMDVWVPTKINGLGINQDLGLIVHIGFLDTPELTIHRMAPKTEKIQKGKQHFILYKIERKYIDEFIRETYGYTNKIIANVRLSLVEVIEGTKVLYGSEKEYGTYMKNTCIIKLTANQKLPIPIKDDWDNEGDDP